MDAALVKFVKATHRFPENETDFRDALKRSGINLDGLRDPWGHNYYATFTTQATYTDRVEIETHAVYGQQPTQHTTITPVTQKVNYIYLRSIGEDGKSGTDEDFTVAEFSRIFTEQAGNERQPKPRSDAAVLTGAGGAISGTVYDPDEALVPGATVTATNTNNSSSVYTTTTDDEGRYALRNLPAGYYIVRFQAEGFQTFEVNSVPVRSSNITQLDANLSVNPLSEEVTVEGGGGAAAVNTSVSRHSDMQFSRPRARASVSALAVAANIGDVVTRSGVNGQRSTGAILQPDDAIATPRLREHFSETLVWQPSLETDARGRAELQFKLADNITTWKMSVIGSTEDGEIGVAEREIRAFQPFFVEHDPPRVLTEGDRIELPVVTRNYLNSAQSVELEMRPESWFEMLGPTKQRAQISAGEAARSIFEFRATSPVREDHQRITAIGSDASDAIERAVTVHPDGEERSDTLGQILSDGVTAFDVNVPTEAIHNSERAEVKIYPNLLAHVAESIEGIMQRPYGCAEQTISAAYPSLLFLRVSKQQGQQTALTRKAQKYLQAGYDHLLNYRTREGGFSYWGRGDEADVALTAHALRFLRDASEFTSVDEDVAKHAREWLVKQQRADGSWLAHTWWHEDEERRSALLTSFVAHVLARDSHQQEVANSLKRALEYLARRAAEIDEPYLMASYTLAAMDAGDAARASQTLARLRSLAHDEGGASYWSLETNTPFYGWGLAGRVETTALVIQALARSNRAGANNDALINRGLLFLMKWKDRYGCWYSTQATVNVLDALITLIVRASSSVKTAQNVAANTAEIFVNGKLATTLTLPSRDALANPLTFDISKYLNRGANRVEIRRARGASMASAQTVTTYYVPWAESASVATSPVKQNSSSALRLAASFDRAEAKVGDEITCRVEVERVGHAGYGMLLAEIGLPPGADVDRESLEFAVKNSNWGINRYDVLPDRVLIYLWPQGGGTSFSFKFHTRFGLEAKSASSVMYDYYNPEARVALAPIKFVVR